MNGKLSGAHQQKRNSSSIAIKRLPYHSSVDTYHSSTAGHWTFKICPSHRVKTRHPAWRSVYLRYTWELQRAGLLPVCEG